VSQDTGHIGLCEARSALGSFQMLISELIVDCARNSGRDHVAYNEITADKKNDTDEQNDADDNVESLSRCRRRLWKGWWAAHKCG